jgi:hypothetical protein
MWCYNNFVYWIDALGTDALSPINPPYRHSDGSYHCVTPENTHPVIPPGPGPWDQFNPCGCRGRTGEEDYTDWFNTRFPNSVRGAKELLAERIIKKACANKSDKPSTLEDFTSDKDDVNIKYPDMRRFGDNPQTWWERCVCIGSFEFKAENIQLRWENNCCFSYSATVYVLENAGADAPWEPGGQCCGEDILWFTGCFVSRKVRMAEWTISGDFCCDED